VDGGARMLGATSSSRKYIGTDPLTTPELMEIAKFLELKDYTLINSGSENYRGDESSIDLCFSSPPYITKPGSSKEVFSLEENQAFGKGDNYFYNVYWKQTLENCKHMLKPNRWFGLNLTEDCVKMISMAKEVFGEPAEIFKLRLVKSHLSGKSKDKENSIKHEPVFMFKNIK
jgi:hypothetical protein